MNELQTMWGWEPALYLFLGGLGAGTFVAATVVYLATGRTKRKSLAAASWTALACLVVGLLLLIAELEAPLRGLMMWRSFSHFTSWMTFGAWVVFAAVVLIGLTALLCTEKLFEPAAKKWEKLGAARDRVVRVLAVLGSILCLGVAVYTGLLLMTAPGVPLWNTWLLPCLFTVSALDTGIAAVVVVLAITKEGAHGVSRALEKAVVCLVLLEALVLAGFVLTMLAGNPGAATFADMAGAEDPSLQMQAGSAAFMSTAAASIQTLLVGELAGWFWGLFVAVGLAVPLACAVYGLMPKAKHPHGAGLAGAACALAGGCALRFLILMAGAHADIVREAVASLLLL